MPLPTRSRSPRSSRPRASWCWRHSPQATGRRGELPSHPRIRPRRSERRPLRPDRREGLRGGDPPMPPGPGFDAAGRPGRRPHVFRRAMHPPPRTGVRAPRGRVTGMAEPSAALQQASGGRISSVSVIVPTWNEAKYLTALLASLTNQTRAPSEIVVADSGGTDRTQDLAEARGAFVVEGERRGPGEGRD